MFCPCPLHPGLSPLEGVSVALYDVCFAVVLNAFGVDEHVASRAAVAGAGRGVVVV